MEKTFVMIKPDGVTRKLTGEIIKRIENKGLNIAIIEKRFLTKKQAFNLYIEHKDKNFFNDLIDYITSEYVFIMLVDGEESIKIMRKIIGDTNPVIAQPGTIRGDYANSVTQNIIHSSDSKESSKRELSIFFNL